MNSIYKTILCAAVAALLGFSQAAIAGPPGHAGGPPFGGDDFNPGGGPPDFANNGNGGNGGNGGNNGNGGGDEEEEEEEDNDASGGVGGPPGFCGTDGEGPDGRAGASHVAHLNFSQRDEDGEIIDDGAWGRMKYVWSGPTFDFVFNGHGLEPDVEYEMTYQLEPVGENGALCLGSGTVNEDGDLHIKNSIELNGDLPMEPDESEEGALLVAVVAEDVDCEMDDITTYEPVDYLFGNALVEYRDTDFEEDDDEEEEEED